ncbi:hypothetical protein D9M68_734630 [compost metagenome]
MLMDLSYILPIYDESLAKLMRRYYANWDSGGAMTITMAGAYFADFHKPGVVIMSALSSYTYSKIYSTLIKRNLSSQLNIVLAAVLSTAWCFSFIGTFFAQFTMYLIVYGTTTILMRLMNSLLTKSSRTNNAHRGAPQLQDTSCNNKLRQFNSQTLQTLRSHNNS